MECAYAGYGMHCTFRFVTLPSHDHQPIPRHSRLIPLQNLSRPLPLTLCARTFRNRYNLVDNLQAMSRGASSGGSRKISFNVSEQYDIQDVVGEGAYGVVWYGKEKIHIKSRNTNNIQFCISQAFRTEGGYQEDMPIRAQHVLVSCVCPQFCNYHTDLS